MKFEVNRDVLSDAVAFVVKLLPQRPTLPILSGVVLEARDGRLQLSTFDYEVSSRTTLDANIDTEGAVLVQGHLLANIAGRLPSAPVQFELDESGLHLNCGRTNFTLPTMPLAEFPSLPAIDGAAGTVTGADFAEAISQVAVAASTEDVAPVITGVHLVFAPDTIELSATDRYRVAQRTINWKSGFDGDEDALVPSRTLSEVGKAFAHADEVTITLVTEGERRLIAFTADGRTVTSLLINGNFPAIGRLFPTDTSHFAVLQTSDLVDATRRMSLVLERDQPLRFTFEAESVRLEATSAERAAGDEELGITLHGAEMVVSLKPEFLLAGVTATKATFVRIVFTPTDNPNKPGPVLITGQTSLDEAAPNDTFRYLLQPNLLMR